jgi:hypothetical protein
MNQWDQAFVGCSCEDLCVSHGNERERERELRYGALWERRK